MKDFNKQALALALQINKQTTDALERGSVCMCTATPCSTRTIALAMKDRSLGRDTGAYTA